MTLTYSDVANRPSFPSVVDSTLEIAGPSAQRVYVIDGTVRLDDPASFTGFFDISRLQSPDTIYTSSTPKHDAIRIELVGLSVTAATASGTTITATLSTGQTISLNAVWGVGPGTITPIPAGYSPLVIRDGAGGSTLVLLEPGVLSWTPGASGDWLTASNWLSGEVPSNTADVRVFGGASGETVRITTAVAVHSLVEDASIGQQTATIDLSDSLTLNELEVYANTQTPGGTVFLMESGSTLTANTLLVDPGGILSKTGTGTAVINAGDIQKGADYSGAAVIRVDGGSLVVNGSATGHQQFNYFDTNGVVFQVAAGAMLELNGPADGQVQVEGNGTVLLDRPISFKGLITLATAAGRIDLAGIAPSAVQADVLDTVYYSPNYHVTMGPVQLAINLGSGAPVGYAPVATSDGNGGTFITFAQVPAPIITVSTAPAVLDQSRSVTIATVAPSSPGDKLNFSGSSPYGQLSLDASGHVIFRDTSGLTNPVFSYTVTDTVSRESASSSGTLNLVQKVYVDAGQQTVTVVAGKVYQGGSGPDEFVVDKTTIAATIDGGSSAGNSLTVLGGGAVVMGQNITQMAAVRLINSATPYDFKANDTTGLAIFTSTGSDVIHDGSGGDIVTINSRTATVYGGGGNDVFYVDPTTIGATIDGGTGHSSLGVQGGGTAAMGSNVTRISEVHLMGGTTGTTGFNFTANATQGLTVVGSLGNDVITVGDASQTIITEGLNSVVKATAATAGAVVAGVHGNPTLEITGGGSATLNANDGHGMIVQIDQAMILNMGLTAFISAVAETSGSTVTAGAPFQTLVTLAGGTTFIGATARNTYADTLKGTSAGLNGDMFVNFGKSDAIDITDVLPAGSIVYTQSSASQGALAFGGSVVTLQGVFNPAKFQMASDGGSGTLVTYLG